MRGAAKGAGPRAHPALPRWCLSADPAAGNEGAGFFKLNSPAPPRQRNCFQMPWNHIPSHLSLVLGDLPARTPMWPAGPSWKRGLQKSTEPHPRLWRALDSDVLLLKCIEVATVQVKQNNQDKEKVKVKIMHLKQVRCEHCQYGDAAAAYGAATRRARWLPTAVCTPRAGWAPSWGYFRHPPHLPPPRRLPSPLLLLPHLLQNCRHPLWPPR